MKYVKRHFTERSIYLLHLVEKTLRLKLYNKSQDACISSARNRKRLRFKINKIKTHFVYKLFGKRFCKGNGIFAVSRTQQGRQGEPSAKTLCFLLSAEFWRHCVLNSGTQCRPLPKHQSEEMEI